MNKGHKKNGHTAAITPPATLPLTAIKSGSGQTNAPKATVSSA